MNYKNTILCQIPFSSYLHLNKTKKTNSHNPQRYRLHKKPLETEEQTGKSWFQWSVNTVWRRKTNSVIKKIKQSPLPITVTITQTVAVQKQM